VDELWQRRLTTEDAEGTESCCVLCVLCALCGFPKPIPDDNKKSREVAEQGIISISALVINRVTRNVHGNDRN
jgi:hypothetical protein